MVETGTTAGYRHPATNRSRRQREQAMTFHEYLAKARQDDAQQAGERDRLLRTARRARRTRRHHTGPTARSTQRAATHPSPSWHSTTAPGRIGRTPASHHQHDVVMNPIRRFRQIRSTTAVLADLSALLAPITAGPAQHL